MISFVCSYAGLCRESSGQGRSTIWDNDLSSVISGVGVKVGGVRVEGRRGPEA